MAASVLAVLGGVFHLDPVPHLMCQYVPERDVVLRRTGENLSAAVARLQHDEPARFTALVDIIRDLPEHEVRATRLVDLPGYYAMMASGGLGDAVAAGHSLDPDHSSRIDTGELDRLLGIA